MRCLIPLALVLLLAACATPREACLRGATGDLSVVDRLIAETQGNLSRGYALRREPYVTSTVNLCLGNAPYRGYGYGVGWNYCAQPTTRYRDVPTAIDRQAEQRKLAELEQTRARLQREANERIAQCDALYPLSR